MSNEKVLNNEMFARQSTEVDVTPPVKALFDEIISYISKNSFE